MSRRRRHRRWCTIRTAPVVRAGLAAESTPGIRARRRHAARMATRTARPRSRSRTWWVLSSAPSRGIARNATARSVPCRSTSRLQTARSASRRQTKSSSRPSSPTWRTVAAPWRSSGSTPTPSGPRSSWLRRRRTMVSSRRPQSRWRRCGRSCSRASSARQRPRRLALARPTRLPESSDSASRRGRAPGRSSSRTMRPWPRARVPSQWPWQRPLRPRRPSLR
mmetsp:Transcript_93880/g.208870  ORF Transcript_93880/g.208870 Transcript_93880/m.208870 type:complete len:222 (-) Transcript_93880:500-1165(-)